MTTPKLLGPSASTTLPAAPPAPAGPRPAIVPPSRGAAIVSRHIGALAPVVSALDANAERLARWGSDLAARLLEGRRLLAAGNGGSAAEAQHLTSELVGRFDRNRRAFAAIALHAESSAVTAIGNDFGYEQVFARQVEAHGRPGDVLVLLSTSGRSANLLAAVERARDARITTWALTGPGPNPLGDACDDVIELPGDSANVQEAHLLAIHCLCRVFEAEVERRLGMAAAR